jgi:hypothetical protein
MTRRSPREHKVHKHSRAGGAVTEYVRGKGKPRAAFKTMNMLKGLYSVTINSNPRGNIHASSIREAFKKGVDMSTEQTLSVEVYAK